jgi:glycine betaine/proline transport system ATP-binding protein
VSAIRLEHVDLLFGHDPRAGLEPLDAGRDRDEIRAETGQILAVRDATLDIAAGEICVLMGLSGSGKSSLVRCVNGLNRPTRGRVCVTASDGGEIDVASCSRHRLRRLRRRDIAMVFQAFALLPWRTVADNVAFGLELRGVARAERRRQVAAMLELVGLDGWENAQVAELSGGMQQRVGLARAFATDAPILLMDEPFSALDPLIRTRLQNELLELQARLKKTIVFVSHDLDEAVKLGDRVAIMEEGAIRQVGTAEEIVTAPADAYVADFLQDLNPLDVLTARAVMAPVREVAAVAGGANVTVGGEAATGRPHVAATTTLRGVIERRREAGAPLVVVDADERVVGTIGDPQIYDGILKRLRSHAG